MSLYLLAALVRLKPRQSVVASGQIKSNTASASTVVGDDAAWVNQYMVLLSTPPAFCQEGRDWQVFASDESAVGIRYWCFGGQKVGQIYVFRGRDVWQ